MFNRKFIFLVFLTFILSFSIHSQHLRRIEPRDIVKRSSFQNIPRLNKGLPNRSAGMKWAEDRIIVKFIPSLSSASAQATIAAYRSKEMGRIPRLNVYKLKLPEGRKVEEMVYTMRLNPDVEYVEPDFVGTICATPNDPLFRYQYSLHNTGQSIGIPGSPQGKETADIKAPAAWEETKGDQDVVIAIIDTGVDFNHPELQNKIVSNGWDFVNGDDDPTDDNGHGTHVAGIAAAETGNDEGIAGVAWNCKILPVKVMGSDGSGYYSDIIQGAIWAADNGADIMNFSIGGEAYSQALEDALEYAFNKDIVSACSSGNEAVSGVVYPAAYDDYALAVGGSDYNDHLYSESNYGPEVDVAAPAVRILSCVPTWYWGPDSFPYAYGFGTSSAAPHVAGLAALIKSIKPWLTADEIMNVIRVTADDVNREDHPGYDDYFGYGRINMERALVPIKITK